MFKWLKTKISNLYNRYKAWKRRHPVLTATIGLSIAFNAAWIAVGTLAGGMTAPVIITPGMFIFASYCVLLVTVQYVTRRVERMNQEVFNKAYLGVAI